MQLGAPPGQPVCKHSLIECVLWKGARASVPQQTPAGPSQPHSAPPFPPGLGRAGEGGFQSLLSSIRGHTVFARHGFSWLLRSPLGGWVGSWQRGQRSAPEAAATWFGTSLAQVPFKLSPGVGTAPYLWVNLGLSARSLWFLQSGSCSCEAGLSFN